MDTASRSSTRSSRRAIRYWKALRSLAPKTPYVNGLPSDPTASDLVSLPFPDVSSGRDPSHVRWEMLLHHFLRKFEDFSLPGVDPEANARQRFVEAENLCRESNWRLRHDSTAVAVNQIIWIAGKIVAGILGDAPQMTAPTWGPGATSSVKGRWLGLTKKLSGYPEGTPECINLFWERVVDRFPGWGAHHSDEPARPLTPEDLLLRDHPLGNKLAFVPKNAKTHRSIAIEPHFNCAIQRAIGQCIRGRLFRTGIDLSKGQELHRRLARESSVSGEFATIDLSMASDTVSRGIVNRLVPIDWVNILDAARSPVYRDGSSWKYYHKHSSMGNGYTFELETLLFLALGRAVLSFVGDDREVFVYGDDIIFPTEHVGLLMSTLEYAGFLPNPSKTFVDGGFRESCGGDYYEGISVSPVYCRSLDSDIELANIHNRLRDWFGGSHEAESLLALIESDARNVNWVPSGYPGGFWTDNPLIIKFKVCPNRQVLLYRALVFDARSRDPDDSSCHLERTLHELITHEPACRHLRSIGARPEFRSSPSRVNTARGLGKWVRRWIAMGDPYEC